MYKDCHVHTKISHDGKSYIIEIIKRYKVLGCKIITIGSNAHNSDDLAKDFDLVYDILRSLNIKEIAVFHNRIPDFISIK